MGILDEVQVIVNSHRRSMGVVLRKCGVAALRAAAKDAVLAKAAITKF
jgi:hypothetical protein